MTRHLFGGGIGDYVVAAGDPETVGSITGNHTLLVPGQVVTFWTAATVGTQITDLLDLLDTEIDDVTTDDNGAIPQFKGPDDGTRELWADASGGDGPRALMLATDIGSDLSTVESDVATLQAGADALAPVATSGAYSDLSDAPALATVATSGLYSDLTGPPAPGLQYVSKVGGTWPVRASTAPDTARPALWIGPSPAPPAGSGYALERDMWNATPT